MTFVNLTPHALNLNDGTVLPSQGIARVSSSFTDFDDNMVCNVTYGNVNGLPEPQEGVTYVVSAMVLSALKAVSSNRTDVVAPATGHPQCVRNEMGQIISVPGFVR